MRWIPILSSALIALVAFVGLAHGSGLAELDDSVCCHPTEGMCAFAQIQPPSLHLGSAPLTNPPSQLERLLSASSLDKPPRH